MNPARPPQPSVRRVRTNVELLLVLSHPARRPCPGANRECLLESTSKPVRVLPRTRISPAGPRGEHPQKKMLKLRNEPTISFRISKPCAQVRRATPSLVESAKRSEHWQHWWIPARTGLRAGIGAGSFDERGAQNSFSLPPGSKWRVGLAVRPAGG